MIGDGRQTYSDSTLMHMSKKELIEIIRCLENNCCTYREQIDQQYKNTVSLIEQEKSEILEDILHLPTEKMYNINYIRLDDIAEMKNH